MQIEQVGEIERFGCFGTGPFRSRSHNAGIGETEISDELFLSVDFGLFAFDRTQRFRVGQSAVARVQSPQSANETNRSTARLKLKMFVSRLGKVDVAGAGGKPGPAEMISGADRSKLGKVTGRIFGQSGFPTRGRLSESNQGE